MTRVARLFTFVDIDDRRGGSSLRARHDAVLEDGRRIVLLDDRGWSGGRRSSSCLHEEIDRNARMVVGPDGPWQEITQAEMDAAHWRALAARLRAQAIQIDPVELASLPHDVEISDRLSAQLAGNRSTGES